jgi:hypothetical protein
MGYNDEKVFYILEDLIHTGEYVMWGTDIKIDDKIYLGMELILAFRDRLIELYGFEYDWKRERELFKYKWQKQKTI